MLLLFQKETDLSGLKESIILIGSIILSISIPTMRRAKGVQTMAIDVFSFSSNGEIQKSNQFEQSSFVEGFVRKQMVSPINKSASPRIGTSTEPRSNESYLFPKSTQK